MRRFLRQLIPFIVVGIIIIAVAFGLMLLAYLFIFGAILGLLLYTIRWIRDKFFPPKNIARRKSAPGRIIDSDDWKKL